MVAWSGRKLSIILAGLLLNELRMKQVTSLYPNKFGEDMQTIHVTETSRREPHAGLARATVVYGGHVGINGATNPGWGLPSTCRPGLGNGWRRLPPLLHFKIGWVLARLAMRLLGPPRSGITPLFSTMWIGG
jgi:hypothetical protein